MKIYIDGIIDHITDAEHAGRLVQLKVKDEQEARDKAERVLKDREAIGFVSGDNCGIYSKKEEALMFLCPRKPEKSSLRGCNEKEWLKAVRKAEADTKDLRGRGTYYWKGGYEKCEERFKKPELESQRDAFNAKREERPTEKVKDAKERNIVVDTKVWVEALSNKRLENSLKALLKDYEPAFTKASLQDLREELNKEVRRGNIVEEKKEAFLRCVEKEATHFRTPESMREQDKFLATAKIADAKGIVSCDEELLQKKQWQGIPVVSTKEIIEVSRERAQKQEIEQQPERTQEGRELER